MRHVCVVSNKKEGAAANLKALSTIHTQDKEEVTMHIKRFIAKNTTDTPIDLFMTGENGDIRFLPYYEACQAILPDTPTERFKHLCGEYTTSSSFALWLACHKIKTSEYKNILIYTNYQGKQHSLMLLG